MSVRIKEGPAVVVKNDELDPVKPEILATAIVSISAGMRRLTKSGLNRKAIVVLIQDVTKLPKHDITRVLDSLDDLARMYTA
jgi:hypothetical protein